MSYDQCDCCGGCDGDMGPDGEHENLYDCIIELQSQRDMAIRSRNEVLDRMQTWINNQKKTQMTYDDWDIRSEDDEHEYDAATRRAYQIAADRHRFLQLQEDRDTGHQLDPLLFEEPQDEEEA